MKEISYGLFLSSWKYWIYFEGNIIHLKAPNRKYPVNSNGYMRFGWRNFIHTTMWYFSLLLYFTSLLYFFTLLLYFTSCLEVLVEPCLRCGVIHTHPEISKIIGNFVWNFWEKKANPKKFFLYFWRLKWGLKV